MLRLADATWSFRSGARHATVEHVEPGLTATVSERGSRPALRFEWAAPRVLTLVAGKDALAYVRIEPSWEAVSWLAARASPGVVAPIEAPTIRAIGGPADGDRWWRAWMRHFLAALDASPASPLFDAPWAIARVPQGPRSAAPPYPLDPRLGMAFAPPPAHGPERVITPMRLRRDEWWVGWSDDPIPMGTIWPLRPPSTPASGRVKAWRKHAARGTLPPIVLLYVSFLGAYVLCDGHDRLHAALLEGVTLPLVALWPTGAGGLPVTRAYRFPGGYPAWKRAVLKEASDLAPDERASLLG